MTCALSFVAAPSRMPVGADVRFRQFIMEVGSMTTGKVMGQDGYVDGILPGADSFVDVFTEVPWPHSSASQRPPIPGEGNDEPITTHVTDRQALLPRDSGLGCPSVGRLLRTGFQIGRAHV